jgi:hypothetical protein
MLWVSYLKKFLVAATAALAQLTVAVNPDSPGGSSIVASEWITFAISAVGASYVYFASNGPHPDTVSPLDVPPHDPPVVVFTPKPSNLPVGGSGVSQSPDGTI